MKPALGIILLAAGESRRLGQAKQLVHIDGISLVRRAAGVVLALHPHDCLVITGAQAAAVTAELKGLPLRCEFNADWKAGMASSIACGARALPAKLDGVMLFLCDQWRVDEADIFKLYRAWCKDAGRIVASGWDDVTGPPVIFPAGCIECLRRLEGDQGARAIIHQQQQQPQRVCMDNARYDLDTPGDLAILDDF